MNLLLINSSEKAPFAAAITGDKTSVHYSSDFTDPADTLNKNPDRLIHCLEKLSTEHELSSADAIAVTTGPGSFTGIRVGLSLAKGFAFGIDKKIIPINNFELTLNRHNEIQPDILYCVLLEAKLPEYYYSLYENGKFANSGAETLENLQKTLKSDTFLVGDFGDETQLKHCYFKYINIKNHKNELDSMSELAKREFEAGNLIDAGNVEPLYLKDFNFKKA
ncbi:MAG: tRNA (adenosine(37)-N6)-threonylcarbamoyltransferase complex dimerization subunit type 1 TsaB [Ignavibacteria bacterium]